MQRACVAACKRNRLCFQPALFLARVAQAQRVMVMGGGLYGGDLHHHAATDASVNANIVALAAAHGASVAITTLQAAQIRWVSLVHPVVMAHTCDSAQRVIDVPFSLDGADRCVSG